MILLLWAPVDNWMLEKEWKQRGQWGSYCNYSGKQMICMVSVEVVAGLNVHFKAETRLSGELIVNRKEGKNSGMSSQRPPVNVASGTHALLWFLSFEPWLPQATWCKSQKWCWASLYPNLSPKQCLLLCSWNSWDLSSRWHVQRILSR